MRSVEPDDLSVGDLSFLVMGDSGTGKTKFIGTLPNPYVFDFDKGMATLHGQDIAYRTFKDAPVGALAMPARGIYEYGTGWTEFIKHLQTVGKEMAAGKWEHGALCFDSVTTMTELAMNNVLKVDKMPGAQPQIQHWGALLRALRSVFDQVTAWPGIKYFVAHLQRSENPITGLTEKLPLIYGRMQGEMPIYFDEVYFADVSPDPRDRTKNKHVFFTQTTPVLRQARSRRNVPNGIEQSWPLVRDAILGKSAPQK